MARITELVAHGFAVQDVEIPEVDANGQPVMNGGGPKTRPGKMVVFIDSQTGDQTRVRLSPEARDEIVRQLTGGVLIPAVSLPKH